MVRTYKYDRNTDSVVEEAPDQRTTETKEVNTRPNEAALDWMRSVYEDTKCRTPNAREDKPRRGPDYYPGYL